jgi:hypothetical protein
LVVRIRISIILTLIKKKIGGLGPVVHQDIRTNFKGVFGSRERKKERKITEINEC